MAALRTAHETVSSSAAMTGIGQLIADFAAVVCRGVSLEFAEEDATSETAASRVAAEPCPRTMQARSTRNGAGRLHRRGQRRLGAAVRPPRSGRSARGRNGRRVTVAARRPRDPRRLHAAVHHGLRFRARPRPGLLQRLRPNHGAHHRDRPRRALNLLILFTERRPREIRGRDLTTGARLGAAGPCGRRADPRRALETGAADRGRSSPWCSRPGSRSARGGQSRHERPAHEPAVGGADGRLHHRSAEHHHGHQRPTTRPVVSTSRVQPGRVPRHARRRVFGAQRALRVRPPRFRQRSRYPGLGSLALLLAATLVGQLIGLRLFARLDADRFRALGLVVVVCAGVASAIAGLTSA